MQQLKGRSALAKALQSTVKCLEVARAVFRTASALGQGSTVYSKVPASGARAVFRTASALGQGSTVQY